MHNNILEHIVHFELKLSLIQWLDEKDWIKSMCIKYVIHFFNNHRAQIYGSWHSTKPKKNEK
jgi:hypothetical protein